VRACRAEVREGMTASRQDAGSVLAGPMRRLLDAGGHLLPVGFYYKWFTRPAPLARLFMARLRPLTGVGRLTDESVGRSAGDAPPARDLGRRPTVVCGAGAAGLEAALAAGDGTLLVDDSPRAGGQRRSALERVAAEAPDVLAALPPLADAHERLDVAAARLAEAPGVEFRAATRVVGAYQPDQLLLRDGEGLATVRADRLVWAGGAWDAQPPFPDGDRPGVIGPRALYRLLGEQRLDVAGTRAVLAGGGLDLLLSAALLHAAGAAVTLCAAPGAEVAGDVLAGAHRLGWTLHTGVTVAGTRARGGALADLPADLAVVCGRGKPAYDVPYQLGVDLVLDPGRGGFVPRDGGDGADPVRVAGEAAGRVPEDVLQEVPA
jgi:hypothetical protein